jgi:hypothetical protein
MKFQLIPNKGLEWDKMSRNTKIYPQEQPISRTVDAIRIYTFTFSIWKFKYENVKIKQKEYDAGLYLHVSYMIK